MGDVDALNGGCRIQPFDRPAADGCLGVSLAREDDGDGSRFGEDRGGLVFEVAAGGSHEKARKWRDHSGQHDLRLGVPEPRVELDHLDALFGEDQAGVEEADEGCALAVEMADDGLGDLTGHQRDEPRFAVEHIAEPREG